MEDRYIKYNELMAQIEDSYYPFSKKTIPETIRNLYNQAKRIYDIILYLKENKFADITEEEQKNIIALKPDEIEMIQACFEIKLLMIHNEFFKIVKKGENK